MARKQVDPLKAKQKKQKILAAVLGVVFLGLLVFQVPRVLKRLHPASPPTSAQTSTTAAPGTGAPSLAAPTLQGAQQSPTTAPNGPAALTSSGAPPVQDGQLASFSRFASKDPFSQQLTDKTGGSSGSSGSGSSASGSTSSGSGSGKPATPGAQPAPGSAVISVNGRLYTVPTGTDFPQASTTDPSVVPVFHLVSLTAHTAKISIVGGSYSSGAGTVTLKERKAVTLMNTADGTRYKIVLMPPGTDVTGPSAPTTTTSATVTLPPPAP